jgi:phenylacetate-CoA ligase
MGLPFRRIIGFKGRSDNMIKLRGINVYPTSVGVILGAEVPAFNGEFVCIVTREGGRDQMTVQAEMRADAPSGLQETCQSLLRARLGVELVVVLAQPGEIKDLTGIESRQKPLRLIDRR